MDVLIFSGKDGRWCRGEHSQHMQEESEYLLHYIMCPTILELAVNLFFFFPCQRKPVTVACLSPVSFPGICEGKKGCASMVSCQYYYSLKFKLILSLKSFSKALFCLSFFCLPMVYIYERRKNVNLVYNVHCNILQEKKSYVD